MGEEREKLSVEGEDVEAHRLEAEEREAIQTEDDEVEGHALVSEDLPVEKLEP